MADCSSFSVPDCAYSWFYSLYEFLITSKSYKSEKRPRTKHAGGFDCVTAT